MLKIKLALVDDELTSRNTIKKYLEDNNVYEVVADFSSGKAALEWLRKNDVDILLCDMQMPEMNGIELMRNIHIINEYLPMIAISGFDNFDYVRGSLINGAANYLLKGELVKEQLLLVLDQVREKYRIIPEGKCVAYKTGYCITDVEEFSDFKISEMIEQGKINFGKYNVIPIAIGVDFKIPLEVNPLEYKGDICKAVLDMLSQILKEKYKYIVYFTKRSHLLVLISFVEECSTLLMFNVISNLVERLQRQMIRMLDVTATIVNGEVHGELVSAIHEAFYLDDLLEDKLYLGGNRIVYAATVEKQAYGREKVSQNLWKQLEFELEIGAGRYSEILQDIMKMVETKKMSREYVIEACSKIINYMEKYGNITEKEKVEIQNRFIEYEIYEQFKIDIMQIYKSKCKNADEKECYSALVKKAIEFISDNYSKEISLEDCAKYTGNSYSYLSREFKKETGMRFVEFLNRYRVNKAKSLLIGQEYSMKDIVDIAGFRNYNYFFKVFKEIEGVTPSEFLNRV